MDFWTLFFKIFTLFQIFFKDNKQIFSNVLILNVIEWTEKGEIGQVKKFDIQPLY